MHAGIWPNMSPTKGLTGESLRILKLKEITCESDAAKRIASLVLQLQRQPALKGVA